MGKFSKQFISGGNAFKQIEEVGKTEDKKENTTVVEPVVNETVVVEEKEEQPVVNETVVVEEPKVEPVKKEETTKITNYEKPQVIETVEDFNKQIKENKESKETKENKETLQKKNTGKKEEKEYLRELREQQKEEKKYYYGQKRTFAINDANWEEVMIYIGAIGKTQHEYINELIEADIRKNAKIIEMAKELRRQTKGDKK